MDNHCIFLEKRDGIYCKKGKGVPCPAGWISTCACIPDDFWNIATCQKKTKAEDPQPKLRAKDPPHPVKEKVGAVKNVQGATSIRDICIFKSS